MSWECEVARCCREKGHETCDTCTRKANCDMLRRYESIPRDMLEKQETEAAEKAMAARSAPVLGKWLFVLFWLVVPGTLADLLTVEKIAEWFPGLFPAGQIMAVLCPVVYGLVLLKLGSEKESYGMAGIFCLVAAAFSAVFVLFPATDVLILKILAAVLSLMGEYCEFTGHAEMLRVVAAGQSEKWRALWKWYIRLIAAMFGSIIVILLIPVLGMLALIAAVLGVGVVRIMKFVYLYQSAKLFREYT